MSANRGELVSSRSKNVEDEIRYAIAYTAKGWNVDPEATILNPQSPRGRPGTFDER